MVKNLPAMQETLVWSLGQEDPLEKGMATHSSILAWGTPWTEEPGGLQSTGSQRAGHDWAPSNWYIEYTQSMMCSKHKFIFCLCPLKISSVRVLSPVPERKLRLVLCRSAGECYGCFKSQTKIWGLPVWGPEKMWALRPGLGHSSCPPLRKPGGLDRMQGKQDLFLQSYSDVWLRRTRINMVSANHRAGIRGGMGWGELETTQEEPETLVLSQEATGDFPGGPVVQTPSFHCWGLGSIPDWGPRIPQATHHGEKKKVVSRRFVIEFDWVKQY